MAIYLLTRKQKEVFDFIKNYMDKNNKSPYIREIQVGCRIFNYKGAVDKLLALEKKGYIRRTLNKHRSIMINSGKDEKNDTSIGSKKTVQVS